MLVASDLSCSGGFHCRPLGTRLGSGGGDGEHVDAGTLQAATWLQVPLVKIRLGVGDGEKERPGVGANRSAAEPWSEGVWDVHGHVLPGTARWWEEGGRFTEKHWQARALTSALSVSDAGQLSIQQLVTVLHHIVGDDLSVLPVLNQVGHAVSSILCGGDRADHGPHEAVEGEGGGAPEGAGVLVAKAVHGHGDEAAYQDDLVS